MNERRVVDFAAIGKQVEMNAIKATWKNHQIVLHEPVNWPEGCDLVVEPLPSEADRIGLDESEWRGDAVSLRKIARTLLPLLLQRF